MDIDKMLNHKIAKLSGIIKRQIYQIISEEGLDITPEQWVILVYLWENDGQTIGDLVTQSQKDFANVTRIVEKLSKNGYIIKRLCRSQRKCPRPVLRGGCRCGSGTHKAPQASA